MKPQIDLVVCAYNEEPVLDMFFQEVKSVIDSLTDYRFRIIVVNDGSKDGTLKKLVEAHQEDARIIVVDLSRNFGHEPALAAGLQQVSGDAAIIMDADLEDPPSMIPEMISLWQSGLDVVNAKRVSRKEDTFLKRWTAKKFYQVINSLSGKINIPENVGNYRLISKRVVELLNRLPERNRVFRVLVPFLGFPTGEVRYKRPKRPAGVTHYNWGSMFRLAVDGITSATIAPLKFAVNLGVTIAAVGFLYMVFVISQALFTNTTVQGWPSIMAAILFLGGVQLLFLGVLGEYLGRVFLEVKNRPVQIISKVHDRSVSEVREESVI